MCNLLRELSIGKALFHLLPSGLWHLCCWQTRMNSFLRGPILHVCLIHRMWRMNPHSQYFALCLLTKQILLEEVKMLFPFFTFYKCEHCPSEFKWREDTPKSLSEEVSNNQETTANENGNICSSMMSSQYWHLTHLFLLVPLGTRL